jgi:DNA-directed RNA polymerase specialized sigma24 family protein
VTADGRPAVERQRIVDWLQGRQESPPDLLARAETIDAVRATLAALAEPHAAALVERYIVGTDVETMARDEGCGATAIRSRLARARKAFCRAFALSGCAADVDAAEQYK